MSKTEQELKIELSNLVSPGSWKQIFSYFSSGRLLICNAETDLAQIGALLVLDEEKKLKEITASGLIGPPENQLISEWRESPDDILFKFLEIPPYCLAKVTGTGNKKSKGLKL